MFLHMTSTYVKVTMKVLRQPRDAEMIIMNLLMLTFQYDVTADRQTDHHAFIDVRDKALTSLFKSVLVQVASSNTNNSLDLSISQMNKLSW